MRSKPTAHLPFVAIALTAASLSAQEARDTTPMAEIGVVARAGELRVIPGAVTVLSYLDLSLWRTPSVNEALQRVPGVHVREEEGFGLRPNIAIRGLSPTRSSKVLLLEDGIPFSLAPYGDNASYWHPRMDRFERIEIVKGSGQILFGPHTIGGVINYVTPRVPLEPAATIRLSQGSRRQTNLAARGGASFGPAGFLASFEHADGGGVRRNTGTRVEDAFLKGELSLGPRHALLLRGNLYRERSNTTYSGLTEAEWAAEPRHNPFASDSMLLDRWGVSVANKLVLPGGAGLTTTAYASGVSRDWWRQSSNSEQRPSDASDPSCGGMANLSTTCGNQGRLRDYAFIGLEPRLHARLSVAGIAAVLDAGARIHAERQRRRQVNSDRPNGRDPGPDTDVNSGVFEENERSNEALAAFVQSRFVSGRWTITPGMRVEHVRYRRRNLLADPVVSGHTALTQLVPGLGATFNPDHRIDFFAGVHRGFSPPRTEDIITNSSGATVDLAAELSWNWEAGVRARPREGLTLEATAFLLEFENQVVPASVAGGAGATLTNAGRTRHAGLEFGGRLDLGTVLRSPHNVFLQAAWTWLPVARYEGARYVYVGTGGQDVVGKVYAAQDGAGSRRQVNVAGNRLPYAPAGTLTAAVGYGYRERLDARLEAVVTGRQWADPLNSTATIPDGQQGELPSYAVVNAAASWALATRSSVFVSVHNVFDRLYIADRTRGLLPGTPRTVRAGLTQSF